MQLLVINFEEYKSTERDHVLQVLEFLDLPHPKEEALALALATKANRGHKVNPNVPGCDALRPEMQADTRSLLEEFYRPHNELLAKKLGNDSFRWARQA